MGKRLARLTSNMLNPYLVGFLVIIIVSFRSTGSTVEALKWASIAIALSILPVFAVVVFLIRRRKLESISISVRRQRNRIYLLASCCAVAGCVILFYLGAPPVLVASFVAGLAAIVAFMGINLLWKISIHSAFVAASVTILVFLYGAIGAVAAVALPLIAWARIKLEHHSAAQVASGALLAVSIVVAVFYLFGLLRPVSSI